MELACLAEVVKNASEEELKSLDRFRQFDGDYGARVHRIQQGDFHCTLARCSGNTRMARSHVRFGSRRPSVWSG